MTDRRWGWEAKWNGALRFYGVEAMREVRNLIDGDPSFTWAYAPWPHEWIDVYPDTADTQNILLTIVEDEDG